MKQLKLTFCGGVGKVTGANFLAETEHTKFLVDCGLVQGEKSGEDDNYKPFPYDPSTIDFLFITHAHIDHIGRVPKIVKDGFKGVIYSTPETKDFAALMLEDSMKVLSSEAEKEGNPPLYTMEDVHQALSLWKTISYHTQTPINDELSIYIKDAGHILGSGMLEFTYNGKKIVFTGDLGNSPTPLLNDTEIIDDADYLIMESVYGDRNHEGVKERENILAETVKKVTSRGGVLVIPVFSLEKTQVLLHELNHLFEENIVPKVPVYLDSPLAIKVTEVYKEYGKSFKKEIQEEMKGDDIFDFPLLHKTLHSGESDGIVHSPNPKIVIAGSGMSNGGRILRHEMHYLPHPQNAILFIGYQGAGTLGRQIADGAKYVTIMGQRIPVRAEVSMITGYSSHKDSDHLVEFVSTTAKKVKRVFVVMGETKSALFLVQRLRDYLGVNAYHPELNESVTLDF